MIKVLFVCHGNICRSPMAEFIFKDMVARRGIVQLRVADYGKYDLLLAMEQYNRTNMMKILKEDPEGKVRLLLDFTDQPGDIADPWYYGRFDQTYADICRGCEGLLTTLGF